MSTITVSTDCGTSRHFDNRGDAERAKETHVSLCDECTSDDVEIGFDPEQSTLGAAAANGEAVRPQATDDRDHNHDREDNHDCDHNHDHDRDRESLPAKLPGSVQTDPLDVVPEYMITEVDGQPTINKRGYAVIANHFDIAVRAEAITTAGETDHEYAEFKATAWRKGDDPERGYTGHATARAAEDRRGIEHNLNEMAETRAMKRAVAWASGVGILAWEEMVAYLKDA